MEKELGVKLLVRGNRRVTLTEDGTYLLNRARELTAIAERTKNNLPSKHALGGDLYIGAGETSGKRLVLHVAQNCAINTPVCMFMLPMAPMKGWWPILRPACMISYCDLAKQQTQYESLLLPVRDAWGILMTSDDPLTDNLLMTPTDIGDSELILPRATHATPLNTG